MAGHNKWSKVKNKKGVADAKRSKIWTKIVREITQATRIGGGDPSGNPRLRKAIDDAKASNMPKENVTRAIAKGSGAEADNVEELVYEGYGPGGVAIIVECMTDNRNRTISEVRTVIQKKGGSLGAIGSVLFGFDKRGILSFDKDPSKGQKPSENLLLEIGLEHGLEDLSDEDDGFLVSTSPDNYINLKEVYEKASLIPSNSEISMVPKTYVKISGDNAKKLLSMIEGLEDLDDVQNVYTNMDIDEKELLELVA